MAAAVRTEYMAKERVRWRSTCSAAILQLQHGHRRRQKERGTRTGVEIRRGGRGTAEKTKIQITLPVRSSAADREAT